MKKKNSSNNKWRSYHIFYCFCLPFWVALSLIFTQFFKALYLFASILIKQNYFTAINSICRWMSPYLIKFHKNNINVLEFLLDLVILKNLIRMTRLDLTCQIISPMFMAGVDPKVPDLRTTSFKGLIRFWWRAANPHLPNLKKLANCEANIFGSADQEFGRSKLVFELSEFHLPQKETPMLPHRVKGNNELGNGKAFTRLAYEEGSQFQLTLKLLRDPVQSKINDDKVALLGKDSLMSLLAISFALGGFGKRSRRGMGSVQIQQIKVDKKENQDDFLPITPQGLSAHLNNLAISYPGIETPYFSWDEKKQLIVNEGLRGNFLPIPYIKEVRFGTPTTIEQLLETTGEVSHQLLKKNGYFYHSSIGAGGKYRLASPIIVSSLPQEDETVLPVITTLNTIPAKGKVDEDLQDSFIKRILEGV
jgi:CRISPR-associated protein Cmr1